MSTVNIDNGILVQDRILLVGDYLDRYPSAVIDALAQATSGIPGRIKFWMQTHQKISLDDNGELINGKSVADYALNQGLITQAQYDEILA